MRFLARPMTSRFFNPLLLWTDVAAQTSAMLLSSSTVIQIRTDRLLRDAMSPGQADVQEIGLMGQEKLAAVSESGAGRAGERARHSRNRGRVGRRGGRRP